MEGNDLPALSILTGQVQDLVAGRGKREWRSNKDIFTTVAHSLNSKDIFTIMGNEADVDIIALQ